MMTLVSFKICPFVQRVTALLEAKHLPYEIKYICLKDKPEWFLNISPHAQIPILITDSGTALFESDAIVEYLDEIKPPIEAHISPEQRALDRAWSYMATKNYLTQCNLMQSADAETFEKRLQKLNKIFEKANNAINKGPFFKGETLSNVDIAWLPLLHRAHIILKHTGHDLLTGYPKIQAWQKAIMKKNMVQKSVSEDFENKFKGFYLSSKTYLGAARSGLKSGGLSKSSCQSANTSCC